MDKKEKAKETVQPEITVENLQTENGTLKDRIKELEVENDDLKKDVVKLKEVRDQLEVKITELTDVKTDSKSNRTENKKGEVKIKFLLSPAGKFLLPYNVGQVVWHNANQADEMVELKYAEYVK